MPCCAFAQADPEESLRKAWDYFEKAQDFAKSKEYQQAAKYYAKAGEEYPKFVNAWFMLGNIELESKNYKEAVVAYTKALAANAGKAEAYLNRGYAKYLMGDEKGALQDYKKAVASPAKTMDAVAARGHAAYLLGDQKQALDTYLKALDDIFYWDETRSWDAAPSEVARHIRQKIEAQFKIKELSAAQKSFLYRIKAAFDAVVLYEREAYSRLIEINPDNAEAYKHRCGPRFNWYINIGDYYIQKEKVCISDFKTAAGIFAKIGNNTQVRYLNARVKYLEGNRDASAGKYLEAVGILNALLQADPGFTPAYYLRARCYVKLRDYSAALADLERSKQTEDVLHLKVSVKNALGDTKGSAADKAKVSQMGEAREIGYAPY